MSKTLHFAAGRHNSGVTLNKTTSGFGSVLHFKPFKIVIVGIIAQFKGEI